MLVVWPINKNNQLLQSGQLLCIQCQKENGHLWQKKKKYYYLVRYQKGDWVYPGYYQLWLPQIYKVHPWAVSIVVPKDIRNKLCNKDPEEMYNLIKMLDKIKHPCVGWHGLVLLYQNQVNRRINRCLCMGPAKVLMIMPT